MVAGLAALGPGGLGPGLRRIGVPFGPTIVVARLPLWKTVQGGGGSALACCTMGPFASGGHLYHGGWGLQGGGLCVTLSFEVNDFWRWGLVPGAF